MELRQLHYFVTVSSTLNFSRAAETLFIAQSTLSQQIADLERELEVQLLKRDKRSVKLTVAGAAFKCEAQRLLLQADSVIQRFRGVTEGEDEGDVVVCVDQKLAEVPTFVRLFADVAHTLRRDYPMRHITFRNREYTELQRALLEGEDDVAFSLQNDPKEERQIKRQILRQEPLLVVYRREAGEGARTLAQVLMERPIIMLERDGRYMAAVMKMIGDLGVEPSFHFVRNRSSMRMDLESGEGVAFLSESIFSTLEHPDLESAALPLPGMTTLFIAERLERNDNLMLDRLIDAVGKQLT